MDRLFCILIMGGTSLVLWLATAFCIVQAQQIYPSGMGGVGVGFGFLAALSTTLVVSEMKG